MRVSRARACAGIRAANLKALHKRVHIQRHRMLESSHASRHLVFCPSQPRNPYRASQRLFERFRSEGNCVPTSRVTGHTVSPRRW